MLARVRRFIRFWWPPKPKVAPVIKEWDKRQGKDYRRPDDDYWIIRLDQRPDKGLARKLKNWVPIVGVSRPGRRRHVVSFVHGKERRVKLEKDGDAVAVIGEWTAAGRQRREQLGYLPKEIAAELAGEERIGATIETLYQPRPARDPGIRLAVWVPRRSSKKS